MLFFFFFQAEDGIRDKLVTGVQTCALPIYEHCPKAFEDNLIAWHWCAQDQFHTPLLQVPCPSERLEQGEDDRDDRHEGEDGSCEKSCMSANVMATKQLVEDRVVSIHFAQGILHAACQHGDPPHTDRQAHDPPAYRVQLCTICSQANRAHKDI